MIVVDTSALAAILLGEPEESAFVDAIAASERALVAAPGAFEFRLAMESKLGIAGRERTERLLALPKLEIAAWSAELVPLAFDALVRFGKKRHPANLNFGDCLIYALAKSLNAPLLFKGDDFAQTDLVSVL